MEFIASITAEAYQHYILQDVILVCIVSFVFAALFYGMLRMKSPSLQWNQWGNVPVDHLGLLDIIVGTFVFLVFAGTYLMPYNPNLSGELTSLSNTQLLLQFCFPIFFTGIICAVVAVRGSIAETFGLVGRNPLWTIVGAIAAYISMFIILVGLESAFHLTEWLEARLGEQQLQPVVNEMLSAEGTRLTIMIIGACVIAPICEEVIFRGYLYSITKRYTGPIFAAICTGVLFGAVHGQIFALIPLACLGIVLAAVYELTGSLWSSILTHCIFNSISVWGMKHPEHLEKLQQKACLIFTI